MRNIKKFTKILSVLLIVCSFLFFLAGCEKEDEVRTLRIYNWQEYIDDGTDDDGNKVDKSVLEDFQEWYKETYGEEIEIQYDTFETNEVMLNTLKTGKTTYDLICPSEYAIQKMIRLDMLEEYDFDAKDANGNDIFTNYGNVSHYITDLFTEKNLNKYAVPYMWGTMGFIYVNSDDEVNSEQGLDGFTEEEVASWDILWTTDLKASAKDSLRDTYVVGVMHLYKEELDEARTKYLNGQITKEAYSKICGDIMNRCDDETIKKVEKELVEMKKNIYSFEVDSGKNDVVTGKISLNFAWSGDAVYAMDIAEEEEGVNLYYSVPEEGSNVWFDGWVIPKGCENKDLAQIFVNYLCSEEVAIRNMDFIGYTSSVVGDAVLERIEENYGPEEGETGEEVDLTYLFDGCVSSEKYNSENRIIVTINERGRQFDAQYPDENVITRCGIMEDFGDQNDKVLAMWENVKIGSISPWANIVVIIAIVAIIILIVGGRFYKAYIRKTRKEKFRVE